MMFRVTQRVYGLVKKAAAASTQRTIAVCRQKEDLFVPYRSSGKASTIDPLYHVLSRFHRSFRPTGNLFWLFASFEYFGLVKDRWFLFVDRIPMVDENVEAAITYMCNMCFRGC